MPTVFLFGAGASYGSDGVGRPPLGADLFAALATFNPLGWGTITGDLAASFQRDFEAAFATVQPHAYGPLLRVMGGYFFHFTSRPTNLYFALAQRIARVSAWSSISMCSLNYERLLELSLSAAGIRPTVGGPSNQASQIELCLPHGCCHLFCDGVRATGMVSFTGAQVQTNSPITIVSDPAQHRARIEQDAMPPVMSYFEPSKRTTSGASFIEAQRARWGKLAGAATTLVIVGVKIRDHDHHIWDPVATTNARVIYCAGPTAALEYEQWVRRTRPEQSATMSCCAATSQTSSTTSARTLSYDRSGGRIARPTCLRCWCHSRK
jgi:hypothetical protein